ncbi:VirK/YbjX family protein [Enterobacter sp.]|uniref:VirK/YbjX family protein n=1 Tax=Enterobacter sp. TaxID=42895 RepID=UPI00296F6AE4|nr:VirK/YbjX family protein [Enterobacter sp.]
MSTFVATPHSALPQPETGWQLFRHLASGMLIPGLAWQNPAYRRKFVLRSLATPFATAKWMSILVRQPCLLQLLNAQPGLPCRLHRPWLSVNISRQTAIDALRWHYQSLMQQLPASVLNGYLSRHGVALATLNGKNDQSYSLRLRADAMLDKEGEATLVFCDAEQTVLAELTFTLCPVEGKNTLYIGGLQGAKAHVDHQLIQSATKACHGLFPKRLLVEAAMAMGEKLGVEQILAVSNQTHIYRNWRYRQKKQDKLHADYDGFWLSLGGEPTARGDYQMPLAMPRKPMEEIASKKRAEYRRRYELLDSLLTQVQRAMD